MHTKNSAAVSVREAVKNYGKKEILKNLNMTVERGSIYGLLGASGCGKTTLLSCIVGRKSLHSGEILVLGGRPGAKGSGVPGPRVGYMPQDIALVGEFTVKDAVFYFGRIFDLPEEVIQERFESLVKLLELPPENRFLKNCSGGQQRRVSFAAAMVHKPELLILDEPTAGVDPLLRDRIWNFLVETTARDGIAVIITTHYIEEAKQANKIGLMRGGRLLAEESPNRLLQLFQTDTLEEAFLILSKRQEEERLNNVIDAIADDQHNKMIEPADSVTSVMTTETFEIGHGSKDDLVKEKKIKTKSTLTGFNRNRANALMDKNWKQFYRNPTGVIFLLILPIVQTLCFLLAVGGDITGLKLAIVNDETMTTTCPNFDINSTAEPYSFSSCHFSNLSCRFLTHLDHPMIHKILYDSFSDAVEDIKHGRIIGALYMADNYTESFETRINDGKDVEDSAISSSEIKVYMDMSNRQTGATLKYKLYDLYFQYQEQLFQDCKWDKKLGSLPMRKNFMYGNSDEPYTIFMTPGTIITILFFMGAMMTSQIIITDRREGVWDRSIVAGVTSLEITLTHFALQAAVVAVQSVEIIVLVFAVYQQEYLGSIVVILMIAFLEGICGMAYGFWVSVISTDHSMANIVVSGGFLPMMLLCGLIWPVEAMPIGLRYFAKCLPFTLAIDSLRNVVKKGWHIYDIEVIQGIGVSLLWILLLMAVSIWMVKLKR